MFQDGARGETQEGEGHLFVGWMDACTVSLRDHVPEVLVPERKW